MAKRIRSFYVTPVEYPGINHYPLFNYVDGIRCYDGTTYYSRFSDKRAIEHIKGELGDKICGDLIPSTLTSEGGILGIKFNEKDLMERLPVPTNNIIRIKSNYGELVNPNFELMEKKKSKKIKKGKKNTERKSKKRKEQGSGTSFISQIQFEVLVSKNPKKKITVDPLNIFSIDLAKHKIVKVKLFRNGTFEIPGGVKTDMSDLFDVVETVKEYVDMHFMQNEPVIIDYFSAMMRNYKTILINNDTHRVDLHALDDVIKTLKEDPIDKAFVDYICSKCESKCAEKVKKMSYGFNRMKIRETELDKIKSFKNVIKIGSPSIKNPDKKVTVKVTMRGKINIDGGISHLGVEKLYYWIQSVIKNNSEKILIDKSKIVNRIETDCSDDSIYDED